MAVTGAETPTASGTKNDSGTGRRRTRGDRGETRLDSHVDAPSTMQPGDAPFDTTDPTERATSVSPDKAAAALAGHGTVNAVVPLPEPERDEDPAADPRYEEYRQVAPNGKLVTIKRNLETGESQVS